VLNLQSAGDYNTTPDRHLGAAQMERLRPDLLISEATYATTLRDSKKSRERSLLDEVCCALTAAVPCTMAASSCLLALE